MFSESGTRVIRVRGRAVLYFEWGEAISDAARTAKLMVGWPVYGMGAWTVSFKVSTRPKAWLPPHDTWVSIRVDHNRWVRFGLHIGGSRYQKGERA